MFRLRISTGIVFAAALAQGQTPDLRNLPPPSATLSESAVLIPSASSWHITAGYQYRQIGELNFKTGSVAAGTTLPWLAGRGNAGSSSSTTSVTRSSFSGSPATTATSSSSTATAGSGNPGSATSYADRTYDDGFVNIDGITQQTGLTYLWGYNNASQVSGGTLRFRAAAPGSVTTTNVVSTGGSVATTTTIQTTSTTSTSVQSSAWSRLGGDLDWNSELAGSGWFARIETPAITIRRALLASLELGYSFVSSDAANRNFDVFRAHQETTQRTFTSNVTRISTNTATTTARGGTTSVATTTNSLVDSYDVSSIQVPSAPYDGTKEVEGPAINNIPDNRSVTSTTTTSSTGTPPSTTSSSAGSISEFVSGSGFVERDTADFYSHVTESLDVDLHTISLGPRFFWEWQRLRIGCSTGLAINIADWEADYMEQLFVRQNTGRARLLADYRAHAEDTEVILGFYLEANANLQLSRRWSLFVAGRYDWAGSITGQVGPSSFDLDLGGWSVLAGASMDL